jgi:pectinesterase
LLSFLWLWPGWGCCIDDHIAIIFFREKVTINSTQPYITFLGEGMNETIITWNDTAGDFDDADVLLKTYRSATVGISSEWFIAKGVQFRNSAPQPAPGAILKQAVAMRISADRAAFYNCSFYGFQVKT